MDQSVLTAKMEAARRLARSLAAEDDGSIDAFYIAGSLTAGLGNPTSDVDLFMLLRSEEACGDAVTQYSVDGHRIDVERYSVGQATAFVDRVVGFELRRDNLAEAHKLPEALDFVIRMHISETVLGSPTLDGLKQRVAQSLDRVQQAAINQAAITINGHLEDFLGAGADDDLDTAAVVGQELLACAGKAVVAAAGDLYVSRKWVYKQLARSPIGHFPMDVFVGLQRGAWTVRGRAGAEDLVFFVNTCVAASQLLSGLGAPLEAWPAWVPAADGDGPWRNPLYTVLRSSDGLLLHWELRRQLILKEHAAIVWTLCDGSSRDDVVAKVLSLAECIPALKELTPHRINTMMTSMLERGLVHTTRYSALDSV